MHLEISGKLNITWLESATKYKRLNNYSQILNSIHFYLL